MTMTVRMFYFNEFTVILILCASRNVIMQSWQSYKLNAEYRTLFSTICRVYTLNQKYEQIYSGFNTFQAHNYNQGY